MLTHNTHRPLRPLIQAIGEETFEEKSIRVAYNLREITARLDDFYNREVEHRFKYQIRQSLFVDIMINCGHPSTSYHKLLSLLDNVVCELPRSTTEIKGYGFTRPVIEVFFGRKYHQESAHATNNFFTSAKPKLHPLPNTLTPPTKEELRNICDEYKKALKECELYFNAHVSMLTLKRTTKQRDFVRCIAKINTKLGNLETL